MKEITLEKQRQKYLVDLMRKNGWEVYEEVYCDEKINRRSEFRLDIMACPPNFNKFIGFELKLYEGCRQGGEFFEAMKQTLGYQGRHFRGHRVELWCIDLYHQPISEWHKDTFNSSWIFMQSFLQKIGIGMIKDDKIIFMISDNSFNHIINDNHKENKTDWGKIYRRAIDKMVDIVYKKEEGNESV